MANFKTVNKTIRKQFPDKDIEVVRGDGYVYFDGDDGWKCNSIYCNPVTTSTENMIQFVISEINDFSVPDAPFKATN